MEFAFSTANSIHFGPGIAKTITGLLPTGVKRVFILTGSSSHRQKSVLDVLENNGYEIDSHSINKEPDVSTVWNIAQSAREFKAEIIVAIGGGSVIDTGKVVAAMLNNGGKLIDYLEGVGKGETLKYPSAPMMAIPTTAGTGSEVTRNSVLSVAEAGIKVSLRSPYLLPRWAVVDPELTYQLPSQIAAFTGMDAFIQCLEAYLGNQANPLTDGIASEGIQRAARSLKAACAPVVDRAAKEDMCVASLCSGMALANSKLGAVHGFAGVIGGMIDAPHGAICASLVGQVLKANLDAIETRAPNHPSLAKWERVAQIVTSNPSAKPLYTIAWLDTLLADLDIQSLEALGFTRDRIPEVAEKAENSSSMKGNPIKLTRYEMEEILEESL